MGSFMFRWLALAVLVGCLSISGYYRRRAHKESGAIPRSQETLGLRIGRSVIALPLFLGIFAYIINPGWMAWAALPLPTWLRWIGVIMGLLSVPSAYWVFTSIGRNVSETVLTKRDHALVTVGPYRWVRHPLYTTGMTLLLAIGLMAANWFMLGLTLIAVVALRFGVVPVEERELIAKFGDQYRNYMLRTGRFLPRLAAAVTLGLCVTTQAAGQQLTPTERARIDSAAAAIVTATGAPSASVAIVRGAQIVYEQAYGNGRIAPNTAARPAMRYAIGSVSKQFTATAILLLADEGKLSLDDRVAKWFPNLTRATDVTVRQLLAMTSGYQDYWPQDYVFTDMQRPATAQQITDRWAGKALDFDPGTKWQYSNTNYVIAGAIVERVAGMPFIDFLKQRIFTPLAMTSVADFDAGPLGDTDAGAYLRNALGPLRPAPKEGKGWLFGAGQLAMTAHDLALWNIAVMRRSILKPASYQAQQAEVLLRDGTATGYGLGVGISAPGGRRRISHGGAVSGYTTSNRIYPDDSVAIVVFTNIYPGAAGAAAQIAERIAGVIFARADTGDAGTTAAARRIYEGLTKGTIDRALLTPSASAYFTAEVLSDYAASLSRLGSPSEFTLTDTSLRGGMTIRSYRIRAGDVVMDLTTMTLPDGRIDQYIISRAG
jgi:D-alanyl-D-alanine carboxypeptidase